MSFYVTTPIYYVNAQPHIGHAHTSILADVLARYHRGMGEDTFFLTGTDEHGQKVEKAAQENQMTPQAQCDATVVHFKNLLEKLDITNDRFIRTTESQHKEVVRKVLQDLYDRDLIYKAEYTGNYCITCERFFTEKDLEENLVCPECGKETSEIIESNYFFKMSQYQDWLIDYIKTHPKFIQPAFRAKETLGFLNKPLNDLCISRPKSRLSWGIELPFDSDYVCYVWFDALLNYISGIGYGTDEKKFRKWWPASIHLMAKDILTTHSVYWPAMLKAMDLPMPETLFVHGWWLVGRDKMSKSLGNAINPMDMIEKYGVDAFRYFLMAEMSYGQDSSFTEEAFVNRFNSDLANDLGNLLSRVIKMVARHCSNSIPCPGEIDADALELAAISNQAQEKMLQALKETRVEQGIEAVMNSVRACNRYLEKTAPWTLAKNGETDKLNTVLYCAAQALWKISILMHPVMPQKMQQLQNALGLTPENADCKINDLNNMTLTAGTIINDAGALFQRIETKEKSQKLKQQPPKEKKTQKNVNLISIDDFFKTELKTATVLSAEKVEKADKLLKLQIQIGSEQRQLVAGIAEHYKPEDIIGRTIVVVANLQPAKIRGIESQGMLLAAKDGKSLKLITVDGSDFSSGAPVG